MIKFFTAEEFEKHYRRPRLEDYHTEGKKVREIVTAVREKGDFALKQLTYTFDKVKLDNFTVTDEELYEALDLVDPLFYESLTEAAENIKSFHQHQKCTSWLDDLPGRVVGQLCRPLRRVGVYVPGGTASYPSSVLMAAIPAKVAGVEQIYLCTPANTEGKISPHVLAAAQLAGVDGIFKIGGAQAIAAMAYGTEEVPAVDKVVGPGNIYVTLAKKEVYGVVGIDFLAGPSEVTIIADGTAQASFIAADMLAQAEHDPLAAALMITSEKHLIEEVTDELSRQLCRCGRRDIAERALRHQGALILVNDSLEACRLVNEIAPEHLELHVADPWSLIGNIYNAGAIFLGSYTPESLGDYWAGPNHILPTGGTARFSSPLGVQDFVKRSSLLYYDRQAMTVVSEKIEGLAQAEGLPAHAAALRIRREGCE